MYEIGGVSGEMKENTWMPVAVSQAGMKARIPKTGIRLAHHAVELRFQAGHHRQALRRAGDVLVDLGQDPLRCGAQCLHGQIQPATSGQVFQQATGGCRVLDARQVMRHMHDKSHRIVPGLTQPELHQRPGATLTVWMPSSGGLFTPASA